MALRCGIVGLPNVGKSTLFNALTQNEIAAENYPFCTIDPNVGVVAVPDARIDELARLVDPERTVPATVEFVDIAGLVAGASKGEGLGNQFLAHIRETHAIAHVVRCFRNDDVVHVSGDVGPRRDAEVIQTELALADLETVTKALDRATRQAKTGDKGMRARVDAFDKVCAALDAGRPASTVELDDEGSRAVRELQLLTRKPVLYVANVDESGFENNPLLEEVRALAAEEGARVVAVCGALEGEIAALPEEERGEFLADMGLEEPGLDRVIRAAYQLLGLQTFFTAGPKEVRAWTVRTGARAPEAAGVIHSDFEKGFIRAEVVAYDDYVACRGEAGARDKGKWRLEGKEYVVAEGDVVHFRFNL